jgi:hypothetical protein
VRPQPAGNEQLRDLVASPTLALGNVEERHVAVFKHDRVADFHSGNLAHAARIRGIKSLARNWLIQEQEWALPFFTIGYYTRSIREFSELLTASEVGLVVDVRSVLRSRTIPQYNSSNFSIIGMTKVVIIATIDMTQPI